MKTISERRIHLFESGRLRSITIPYKTTFAIGAEAFYFQLTKTKGLKIFGNKRNAQISFRRQKKAYRYKLAPKILSEKVFQVIIPVAFEEIAGRKEKGARADFRSYFRDGIAWGYYTQHVRVLDEYQPYWDDALDVLQDRLREIFPDCSFNDLHEYNIGYIGKRVVNIDFGTLSSD
jgi:hypothetical protein